MCTGKEIKSGLKLVRMETDVATNTCKLLLRKKPEHWDINAVFFCKFLRNKSLSQKAYFTLKLGWLKTNAGTNIGPQNNMYLSAPEILLGPSQENTEKIDFSFFLVSYRGVIFSLDYPGAIE